MTPVRMRSFFFSSRRRHTRSYGDWSSDVCSSDLLALSDEREHLPPFPERDSQAGLCRRPFQRVVLARKNLKSALMCTNGLIRSEERRVGKEWRSRWRAWV